MQYSLFGGGVCLCLCFSFCFFFFVGRLVWVLQGLGLGPTSPTPFLFWGVFVFVVKRSNKAISAILQGLCLFSPNVLFSLLFFFFLLRSYLLLLFLLLRLLLLRFLILFFSYCSSYLSFSIFHCQSFIFSLSLFSFFILPIFPWFYFVYSFYFWGMLLFSFQTPLRPPFFEIHVAFIVWLFCRYFIVLFLVFCFENIFCCQGLVWISCRSRQRLGAHFRYPETSSKTCVASHM